jgi:predicted permease
MMNDVKRTLRSLIRAPGYSTAVVLILALGIGATTTIFSVVNGVLLRPLPFPDEERLLMLWQQAPGVGVTQDWFSPAQYFDLREQVSSLEDLALVWGNDVTLGGDGEKPTSVGALAVTSSFFHVLGITPALGRPLTARDDDPSATPAVVLGHDIFSQRFGGDPDVVGTTVTVDGRNLEVVGVLPSMTLNSNLLPTLLPIDVFDIVMSLPLRDPQRTVHGSENFVILAKLTPEATSWQLETELTAVAETFTKDPGSLAAGLEPGTGYRIAAVPLIDQVAGKIRLPLLVLLGGTGLLLAIACVNVANVMLTRAATEHRQLSIRAALGAGRARMIRQSMLHSLILSFLGGVAGLAITAVAVWALHGVAPQNLPRLGNVGIDPAVLLFAGGLCIASTLLFGSIPALRISSVAPNDVLSGAGMALGALSLWRRGGSRYLIVVQVALSMMLVTGAGLLVRSVLRLQAVDPGFQSENVLSFRLSLVGERYTDPQARIQFYDQLLDQLPSLAGIDSAGGSTLLPFTRLYSWTDFIVEGQETADDRERVLSDTQVVTPGYFETMSIPLLAGRTFDDSERQDAQFVIVDRMFAERFWSVDEAIGKWVERFPGELRSTIVGVVDSVKHYGLAADPHITVFYPHKAAPTRTLFFTTRTTGEPLAMVSPVVDTIQKNDPDLPIYDIQTMSHRLERSLATERSLAALLNLFSGVALILASVGLYSVLSFSVAAHTHEIGIRKALGARSWDLHRLVLSRAGVLTASGIALGVVAALMAESIFQGLVYGISTTDPLSFTAAAALVSGVALAAGLLPARRAARVDPLIALKTD